MVFYGSKVHHILSMVVLKASQFVGPIIPIVFHEFHVCSCRVSDRKVVELSTRKRLRANSGEPRADMFARNLHAEHSAAI